MDAHDRTARNSQTPLQLAKFASKSCKLSFKPVLIQQKSASRKHFPVAGPAARPSKKKKRADRAHRKPLILVFPSIIVRAQPPQASLARCGREAMHPSKNATLSTRTRTDASLCKHFKENTTPRFGWASREGCVCARCAYACPSVSRVSAVVVFHR